MVLKKSTKARVPSPAQPHLGFKFGDRLTIAVMLLLPIPSFIGDFAARAADAIRFGAVSGRLISLPRFRWGRHTGRTAALLFLMFACAFLSLVYGVSHTPRDLLDVLRIAAYSVIFFFGGSIAHRSRGTTEAFVDFCKCLLFIGLMNALFSISQYSFPNFTHPLQSLYAVGEYRELRMEMVSEQRRAIGFFGNPNINAVMLLLLSLPGITLFQVTKRYVYLALGALVSSTILLTGSRTGVVLAAVALVILGVTARKISYLVALSVLVGSAYTMIDFLVKSDVVRDWFPYLTELVTKIYDALQGDAFDIESINSFSARRAIWENTLDWYHRSPVWGSGPLRDEIPSFADNYYVYLLSRYGTVGLVLYSLFALYVAILSARAILSGRQLRREWGTTVLVAVVIVNLANYSMDAFLTVPIASILLLYMGYLTCVMDGDMATQVVRERTSQCNNARSPRLDCGVSMPK